MENTTVRTPTILEGVIGRGAELAMIEAFLGGLDANSGVFLLEGEPGIGKTTVWQAATRLAEARGFQVLDCRPAEFETRLSFAALADLAEPLPEDFLGGLPKPQRHALEVALLRVSPGDSTPDPRAVAVAFRSLLVGLAQARPLLVAIDDAQWLDTPSARAIEFAFRRLATEPIGLLAARRPGEALEQASRDTQACRLGPLGVAATHHVIKRELGYSLSRPVLVRVHEATAGNPFFALEIARTLHESQHSPGAPLPVPRDLSQLVLQRLSRLSSPTREILLVAAALANPSHDLLAAVSESDTSRALEEAGKAGIIDTGAPDLRFRHPLYAAAVYSSAPHEHRRRLHRRLADVVEDLEERARHLALAALGSDERIAAELGRAALQARSRGAPSAAAELMDLSCKLTPATAVELPARRLELAELELSSGDARRAQSLAQALIETLPAGPMRARVLVFLAQVLHLTGKSADASSLCAQALDDTGGDQVLSARAHVTLALISPDFRAAAEHAHAARALLEGMDDPDPALMSQVLKACLEADYLGSGQKIPMDSVERAIELERRGRPARVADRLSTFLGTWLKYSYDFEGARFWLGESYRAAVDEGDEGSLPDVLLHYPQLELWTGNWARAEEAAREHVQLAEQTGQAAQRTLGLWSLAMVLAHQGREGEARDAAAEALSWAEEEGDEWAVQLVLRVLGFLELSAGRPTQAVAHFERAFELLGQAGSSITPKSAPDFVESLVAIGALERARRVLSAYGRRASAGGSAVELAADARSRALLLAAEGDLDRALESAEEALGHHEGVSIPLDVGRAHLVHGQLRRRCGERRAAREALERALAIFTELGASLWAERAAEELRRLPIRRGAPDELTHGEARVAELAATGKTNREVAQALFMSPKTVEASLSRAYRKLGIRSRAELGARMAERSRSEGAAKT